MTMTTPPPADAEIGSLLEQANKVAFAEIKQHLSAELQEILHRAVGDCEEILLVITMWPKPEIRLFVEYATGDMRLLHTMKPRTH